MAEQLLELAGEPMPYCHYHARAVTDEPKQKRPAAGAGDELSDADQELLGGLESQLAAADVELGPLIMTAIRKMLLSDSATAQAAVVRMLLDRYAPVEGERVTPTAPNAPIEEMSTAALRAEAFPVGENLSERMQMNPAVRAERVAAVHSRWKRGFHVRPDELEEAKQELDALQSLRTEADSFMRSTEPIAGLSFRDLRET
jgi:hypothetical protein